MKQSLKNVFIPIITLIILLLPGALVFGAHSFDHVVEPSEAQHQVDNNSDFPRLQNPIKVNSINALVTELVNIAFQIGSVVAVLMIIYSGFKFVMARGNESQLEDAKRIFFYTIIGIAVLFGSKVLAEIIRTTVENLKNY
jgi:hypothetical protein